MDLYLIRHADALPLDENNIKDDAERPLSKKGEGQAKALASALHRRGVLLDKVVTSPLRRAHQTAEGMLGQWWPPVPELCTSEELAPAGKKKRLAKFLRKLAGTRVALIGHQPDLGELAAWLIGSKKARIDLAKASIACISCDDEPGKGGGALLWLVPPEWFGGDDAGKAES
jgi:phosphohistidine phosphatase